MNVFCQSDEAQPRHGDMAVWNAERCRWEFQAAASGSGQSGGYAIGEWKDWHLPLPPLGWKVRDGQLLTGVSTAYPELAAFLHRPEHAPLLKTEAEWQALRDAAGGIGGAWFYVLDKAADTIRLPDTRGDFVRDAGGRKGEGANDGVYGVGEWHGDAIRNIEGDIGAADYQGRPDYGLLYGQPKENAASNQSYAPTGTGPFIPGRETPLFLEFGNGQPGRTLAFDASLTVPTANENRPRAGMLLGCVYVGR